MHTALLIDLWFVGFIGTCILALIVMLNDKD